MARHLILFVHADPRVTAAYEQALAPLTQSGDSVELRFLVAGALSSAYTQLAADLRDSKGRHLPRLLQRFPPRLPPESYATISLVTFSAGYGLARAMLGSADDQARISAYVALDSIHAGFKPGTKKPLPEHLAPFAAYARRAREGSVRFWIGHSDVKTNGYASTTDVALALTENPGVGGHFVVRAFDVSRDPYAEHRAALVQWGPSLVAEALIPWLPGRGDAPAPPIPPEAWRDPGLPLGTRTLLFSQSELERPIREEPLGSSTSPRIKEYFAPCVRDGRKLNLTKGDWCAAAACFALEQCVLPGESEPHSYRAAGIEMQRDLVERNAWRPLSAVLDGAYLPEAGDLVILKRGPEAWMRHVCRVVDVDVASRSLRTIGGNEGDRWSLTDRRLAAPILGFGEMPGMVTRPAFAAVEHASFDREFAQLTPAKLRAAVVG